MSPEQLVTMRRRFYQEVLNTGDVSQTDRFVAHDFVNHAPFPGMGPDREGFKRFLTMFATAFPDARWTCEDAIAQGDRAATRFHLDATNTGPFGGTPATGKRVSIEGFDIVRMRDGLMVEHWGLADSLAMQQQLGLLPGPDHT